MIENQHSPLYLQHLKISDVYIGKSCLEVFRIYYENKKVLHIGCSDYPNTNPADNFHI